MWSFLDFVDANGVNQMKAWISELPVGERIAAGDRFRQLLLHLRGERVLNDPHYTKMLRGSCTGLMELRFKTARNVPYRPLAFYGPEQGEITLLMGAIEHNNRLVPPNACQTALERKSLVERDRKYVVAHDFT